jgi:hypothetical protein
MSEADVFHMLIMHRREWREKQQQQRVDLYNVIREWEARESVTPCFPQFVKITGLAKNYGKLINVNM